MSDSPIPDSDGKYLIINALTRRSRDLARGSKPTIPYAEGNVDPLEVAQEEFAKNKVILRRRNDLTGDLEPFELDAR